MKIMIKNKQGASQEVSPENIEINGLKLLEYIKKINTLEHELNRLKHKYDEDVKALEGLWNIVKKKR